MSYNETIQKWNEQATNIAAIHPAGRDSEAAFMDSGYEDAKIINDTVKRLGLDPGSLSILDYGCGVGRVAIPLTSLFAKVLAVDSSEEMIFELDKKNVPLYENLDYTFHDDPFYDSDEKFDVAVSISVFIHYTYEDGVKMLNEVASMVKEGGMLLLQIPVYDVAREAEHWSGVTVWSREQFRDAVKEAGLWIVEMWSSPGAFSYDQIGVNHHKLQILQKL